MCVALIRIWSAGIPHRALICRRASSTASLGSTHEVACNQHDLIVPIINHQRFSVEIIMNAIRHARVIIPHQRYIQERSDRCAGNADLEARRCAAGRLAPRTLRGRRRESKHKQWQTVS